jgi:hypothetical protein
MNTNTRKLYFDSAHKSGKDEVIHQLKTELEQKNELDLKLTKLER